MKYRTKPCEIEAYQTDKEIIIHTLEGDMKASVGDYIITGLNGEQYPCKPDIFEKKYERADKQTNYDRIRNMSVDEMAEFIPDWSYTKACKCDEETYADCNNECSKCVKEWLESEVSENER